MDGEGRAGKYVLLQDSDGNILHGDPITIRKALHFLFRPDRTCVWYGAGYDWNMLFANESKDLLNAIFKDKEHIGMIDQYEIQLFPKKILRIRDTVTHETSVHYDTIGFFQCALIKALKDWNIPVPDIVTQGKRLRDEFPADFNVELYNYTETQLHLELMNRLYAKIQIVFKPMKSGDYLSGWHGAGVIAARMLDDFHVTDYSPLKPLHDFRGYEYQSYYGGRIELFQRGLIKDVYNYDINSAYPAATRELPALKNANWIHTKGNEALDYEFGVARVSWTPKEENEQMGCFPFRLSQLDGKKRRLSIYPVQGEGYYHLVEIKAAIARDLWNIELKHGIAIEPGFERPFWAPINDIMTMRLAYKKAKDMAHIPLKLGANSFYGKFAQRNKDKKEFGAYANYWYAGYITAWTRAELLKYAIPDSVILMATDGLYSTQALKCPIGGGLGEWEFEHYNVGKFILPGIYKVDDTVKSRGFPKLDFENVFTRILNGEKPTVADKLFVGVRRSLQLYKKYPVPGFYHISKKINWNSVNDKRTFVTNYYSEPRNPFLDLTLEQRISAGFLPWESGTPLGQGNLDLMEEALEMSES